MLLCEGKGEGEGEDGMGRRKKRIPPREKKKAKSRKGEESTGSLGPNDQRPSLAWHAVPAVGDGVGRGWPRGDAPRMGLGNGEGRKAGEVVLGWVF
jgi:hypothetical protein